MYSDCIRCPKLGKECDGPNFVAMPPQELISWCKERKKHLGLTNAKLSDMTNMPQGTIDSLLSNTHPDFKFGTIRPLLQVLVGGDWLGDPCADPTGSGVDELQKRIKQLEIEISYKDKEIAEQHATNQSLQKLIENTNARMTKDKDFLREQIRSRNKAVAVLSACLGICLLVIIGALVIDKLNPDMGFFWLDGLASILNSSAWFRLNT